MGVLLEVIIAVHSKCSVRDGGDIDGGIFGSSGRGSSR